MRPIFIVGSCATRDAFDIEERSCLVGYVARSSFGSSFKEEPFRFTLDELDPSSTIKGAFQRRMICHDLSKDLKALIRQVADKKPLFIVDFIDERFSLLEFEGTVATHSLELMESGCLERNPKLRLVKSCSDEHFSLWCQGFTVFANLTRALDLTVLVNRVLWAGQTESGRVFDPLWIETNNQYLQRMYSFVSERFGFSVVPYEGVEFIGSSSHRWGEAPYHYRPDVYSRLTETLRRLACEGATGTAA